MKNYLLSQIFSFASLKLFLRGDIVPGWNLWPENISILTSWLSLLTLDCSKDIYKSFHVPNVSHHSIAMKNREKIRKIINFSHLSLEFFGVGVLKCPKYEKIIYEAHVLSHNFAHSRKCVPS